MHEQDPLEDQEVSLKDLFIPFTAAKAITWIVIIGLVVYANMLFNGFVWDDKTYILFNRDVLTFNITNLLQNNIFNAGGQYRPIPAIYFATLFALFKDTTFFYHLLQLALHIVNACLVFVVFKKFFAMIPSFLLSILFLIHPIQVESVSYIASSGNPLYFLFGILALLISLNKTISGNRASIIGFLLTLSLLAKEAGLVFFFIVFLYKLLFNRKGIVTLFFAECASLFIYFIIRFGIGGVFFTKLSLIPIAQISLSERLLSIPAIIFYYIKTSFLPLKLAIDQQWVISSITFKSFYFPLLVDILFFSGIGLLGLYIYKTKQKNIKTYLFFLSWFIAGFFLYWQIFPLDGTVADRWFYFPLVGLLGIVGAGVYSLKIRYKFVRPVGYTALIVIFMLLAVRTIVRNANWSDAITLYAHDTKISNNFDIENNLGTEYANVREYDKAIAHSKKSVEMFPYEANLYNLANTYEQSGNIQEAKKYYAEALTYPNYLPINHRHIVFTYIRLAYMMYLSGEYKNSEEVIRQGLREYPNNGYLLMELAACEYKKGNQTKALSAAEQAVKNLPTEQMNALYLQIQNKQPILLKL